MPPPTDPPRFELLGVPIAGIRLHQAVDLLRERARSRTKGYVIFRDVHGLVRCQDDPALRQAHRQAWLICPDGMPLVWIGRRRGFREMGRVYGPDLMRALLEATRDGSATHFLYGGKPGVAEALQRRLEANHPGVRIVGTYTPPFSPLSPAELDALTRQVASARPDFFWVGLSTPKQETFMAQMLPLLDATVMLGVGAAFDYLSGTVAEPPAWLRNSGLQWLARILQEPRRLAPRYLQTLPRFLVLWAAESRQARQRR